MAKGFSFGAEFVQRIWNAVRWVERQRAGGIKPRGFVEGADPFERVKLTAELAKGGSATADMYTGNAADGWTLTGNSVTVYEDDWLETGETIASGKDVEVKWMHGVLVLNDQLCSDIDS